MGQRRNDISGKRSGHVVAIEPTTQKHKGSILWRCRCDCGKELMLESYKITHGKIQSCGCMRNEKRRKELSGQTFGKLTVLHWLNEKRGNSYLWLCRCACGNEVKVTTNALLSGNTKSCGCGRSEAIRHTIRERGTVVDHVHLVEGTCVEKLKNKRLQRNNTSGYTGVQARKDKWIALITFKKKVHYLGTYACIEDAVKARKKAEEQFFSTFLDRYYEQAAGSGEEACAES